MSNLRWGCEADGCYRDELPDWTPFNEALAPCALGDIDGLVERRGHFLVIEWKRPGASMQRAQERALAALDALPQFTVWIVHGTVKPMAPQWLRHPNGRSQPVTLSQLQDMAHDWYRVANEALNVS